MDSIIHPILFIWQSESLWIELDHHWYVAQFEALWCSPVCVYIDFVINAVRVRSKYHHRVNALLVLDDVIKGTIILMLGQRYVCFHC